MIEYYPSGFFEKTGNLWRVQGRRMRLDFKHFQRFVTLTDEEPEGWRGEIRDGEVVVTHEEAMEKEEAESEESDESDDSDGTTAIRAFNEHVRGDDRVVSVMLTVRDGVTLIRRA